MQKIPIKKKSEKFKLNEEEKNLALLHRNQVNEFFSNNDPEFNGEVIKFELSDEKKNKNSSKEGGLDSKNNTKEEKLYLLHFDNLNNLFYLNEWDHSKIESFGVKKDKKLFLSTEEAFFLLQNFILKFPDEEHLSKNEKIRLIKDSSVNCVSQMTNSLIDILISKNIFLNTLLLEVYSHLRRSGKLVLCPSHMKNDNETLKDNRILNLNFNDYLIFFDKLEDYRNRTISGIVYICKNESISVKDFDLILNESKELIKLFYRSNLFASGFPVIEKTITNVFVTFHESENITFLKISEINPINEE